jgi:hypothetical protein
MAPADRILATYTARNFPVDAGADVYNIFYVEGADRPDFTPNKDRGDAFDAIRCLWQVLPAGPAIVGMWDATTHSGAYYEQYHLLNSGGAWHIGLGPQEAWERGIYHGPALRQVRPLYGTRDFRRDFTRTGTILYEDVGCHHHHGDNLGKSSVGAWAAGCQVARMIDGHEEFMAHLDQDRRQRAGGHIWRSTVIPVGWLA